MNRLESLKSNKEVFFNYMKEKYPLIYTSNVFLRDIQYSIKSYFEAKDEMIKYSEAEKLAQEFAGYLESTGEFVWLSKNTWKVNFRTEVKAEPAVETVAS